MSKEEKLANKLISLVFEQTETMLATLNIELYNSWSVRIKDTQTYLEPIFEMLNEESESDDEKAKNEESEQKDETKSVFNDDTEQWCKQVEEKAKVFVKKFVEIRLGYFKTSPFLSDEFMDFFRQIAFHGLAQKLVGKCLELLLEENCEFTSTTSRDCLLSQEFGNISDGNGDWAIFRSFQKEHGEKLEDSAEIVAECISERFQQFKKDASLNLILATFNELMTKDFSEQIVISTEVCHKAAKMLSQIVENN